VNISAKSPTHSELEIGHVLFMDVVGYSKLLLNEQREIQQQLNQIVRSTEHFCAAEAAGKLIRLPVGDGIALVFFNSPEAPVQCALEIGEALKANSQFKLRMGIHSGPVSGVTDVNDRSNVAGSGINMAQRVMDCGDAGHILLSKRAADDLAQDAKWRSQLHELGECLVKHGAPIFIVNLYSDKVGNPQLPEKIKAARRTKATITFRRRSLFAGIAIFLAAALAFFVYKRQPFRSTVPEPGSEKSVAVLPLENLSEQKENAYFADGIQDELLTNLSKIKNLKVISRTSVMQYKSGITRNLKEIAHQLGVTNVVEGSVRRAGNHIRVNVQLIDALTDRHIWAQNYDRMLADSLTQQGELATEIAAAVGTSLSPQEKARIEATPTKNAAAYDAYLRGRAFAAGSPFNKSEVEGAIRSYQEAVKLDPNFVVAWAYLSSVQSGEYWVGLDATEARLVAAKEALDRAITLDPNLPETHLALGYYRYYGQRDFAGALAEFQLAEQGFPNNVDVLQAIFLIHRRFGHWNEAIEALRRVVELDPRNIQSASMLANTYMFIRHFSDAIAMADHILAVEAANESAIGIKAYSFWAMGNLEAAEAMVANPNASLVLRGHNALARQRYLEAADILAKASNGKPDREKAELFLELGLAQRAGNLDGAKATYQHAAQEFQRELGKAPPDSGPAAELHSNLGIAYAGLGDAASAVAEGEKGIAMQPSSEDPFEGPLREEAMAQIYGLLGDADHAIPILRRLVAISSPTGVTPGLMRIDPIWDPIRNDPRFQELIAEKKP